MVRQSDESAVHLHDVVAGRLQLPVSVLVPTERTAPVLTQRQRCARQTARERPGPVRSCSSAVAHVRVSHGQLLQLMRPGRRPPSPRRMPATGRRSGALDRRPPALLRLRGIALSRPWLQRAVRYRALVASCVAEAVAATIPTPTLPPPRRPHPPRSSSPLLLNGRGRAGRMSVTAVCGSECRLSHTSADEPRANRIESNRLGSAQLDSTRRGVRRSVGLSG